MDNNEDQRTTRAARRPERRFTLGTWFEDRAKTAVGVYWFPGERRVVELRGSRVTTIGETSPESADALTVTWLEECPYSDERRRRLVREAARVHRTLREARVCDG